MKITSTDELTKLAELVFHKIGLEKSIPNIKEEIEEEIYGAYTCIDDEEEEEDNSYRSYGGIIYERYYAITDGKLSYCLDKKLAKQEKELLLKLIQDNNLIFPDSPPNSAKLTW